MCTLKANWIELNTLPFHPHLCNTWQPGITLQAEDPLIRSVINKDEFNFAHMCKLAVSWPPGCKMFRKQSKFIRADYWIGLCVLRNPAHYLHVTRLQSKSLYNLCLIDEINISKGLMRLNLCAKMCYSVQLMLTSADQRWKEVLGNLCYFIVACRNIQN